MREMAGKAILKETIRKNTITDMKKLGVFKNEYLPLIDIYSEMREQYERLTKKFKETEYEYSTGTMQGGEKKSPLVATLEILRKDIVLYSDRLCLSPKAMQGDKGLRNKQKTSTLEAALKKIE